MHDPELRSIYARQCAFNDALGLSVCALPKGAAKVIDHDLDVVTRAEARPEITSDVDRRCHGIAID